MGIYSDPKLRGEYFTDLFMIILMIGLHFAGTNTEDR
jgi:hypothetical protein